MPIDALCPYGRQLKVADKLAGKVVRCPDCQGRVTIPPVGDGFEVVDVDPPAGGSASSC
jgi:hypothetical protein